jgi:hypothetical protein
MNGFHSAASDLLGHVPKSLARFLTGQFSNDSTKNGQAPTTRGNSLFIEELMVRFPESVVLPRLGEVAMDTLMFCSSVVLGTMCIFYQSWRTNRHRKDRLNKPYVDPREEAHKHAWKRTNGFRDQSLYAFMDTCVNRRKRLRKVIDPEAARKARVHEIKLSDQAKPKGPLGLSPDRLQIERGRLQNVTNKPPDYHDVKGA